MVRNKPFSKTEMKILIFNKMKKGLSYEDACAELGKEIHMIIDNSGKYKKKQKKEQEDEKEIEKRINKKFKEEFQKLANGEKG